MAIFAIANISSSRSLIYNALLKTKDVDHWNLVNSPVGNGAFSDFQPHQQGDK